MLGKGDELGGGHKHLLLLTRYSPDHREFLVASLRVPSPPRLRTSGPAPADSHFSHKCTPPGKGKRLNWARTMRFLIPVQGGQPGP